MKSLVSLIASLTFAANLLFPQYAYAQVNDPAAALVFEKDETLIQQFKNDQQELERLTAELEAAKEAKVWRSWRVLTAYSSTPDQTDDTPFITAFGTKVRDGLIAANFLQRGTKVRIPALFGEKIFTVEDRMHQRFTSRVDIWFPSRASAKEFGVRVAQIEVLR